MSVARPVQRRSRSSEGRQPPGKIIVVGEASRALLDLVCAVVDRDRLEQHQAFRVEQLGAAREERVEVLPAHRLDHLDRDELRRSGRASRGSPACRHLDAVLEPRVAHPLGRGRVLLAREWWWSSRGSRSARPRGAPTSPSRVPISSRWSSGVELELAAGEVELRSWASRRVCPRRLPHAARVGHGLVEEELEEVVAEVVVGGDVLARPPARVAGHPCSALRSGASRRRAAGRAAASRGRRCAPAPPGRRSPRPRLRRSGRGPGCRA